MWRLWHRLFGWQYVYIENSAARHVRRVWFNGSQPMVSAYEFQHWPLEPPFHGWKVTGLTPEVTEYLAGLEKQPTTEEG